MRKSVDEGRYVQRFTPRRARSKWSLVNIKRVGELQGARADVRARPLRLRGTRPDTVGRRLDRAREREADAAPSNGASARTRRAWAFFQSRPPGYRRLAAWFVMSAKKDETRLKRLATLIAVSAKGRPLPGLDRPPRPAKPKS